MLPRHGGGLLLTGRRRPRTGEDLEARERLALTDLGGFFSRFSRGFWGRWGFGEVQADSGFGVYAWAFLFIFGLVVSSGGFRALCCCSVSILASIVNIGCCLSF